MSKTLVRFTAGLLLLLGTTASSFAGELKEINFGIINTDNAQTLMARWEPLMQDMEKSLGVPVKGFFPPDYSGVIVAMQYKKVDVAWFGNDSGIDAVDRAGGEVFAQQRNVNGDTAYWSVLIAPQDSPLNSLDDMLKSAPGTLTFGNGDPESTSGYLMPGYYVFIQNHIDPKTFFKRVVLNNHGTNVVAIVNKQVDVATNNTINLSQFEISHPEQRKQIKIIWKSPAIPLDPMIWRKDLPEEAKTKIRAFFLNYGRTGPNVKAELAALANLHLAPFVASSNDQLNSTRLVRLYGERSKVSDDEHLNADEKAAKLKEIDAKIVAVKKRMAEVAKR